MKRFFYVLLSFLILTLQTYATTWVKVDDYEYIDKDSIEYYINDKGEKQYDQKVYWMKTINNNGELYKQIEKDIKKKISYVLSQRIINITQKKVTIKSIFVYDEDCNSIFSYTKRDLELNWDSIVPNSNGKFWFELIKKPSHLRKMYKKQLLELSN